MRSVQGRKGGKSPQKVYHRNWMVPKVGDLEVGGVCVTVKEVGDGVAPNQTFWAGGVNRATDAHLVIFQEITVPSTELCKRATFLTS